MHVRKLCHRNSEKGTGRQAPKSIISIPAGLYSLTHYLKNRPSSRLYKKLSNPRTRFRSSKYHIWSKYDLIQAFIDLWAYM
ncbi:uncharacterized protein KLLA0_F10198g [Kluyveromyces lactis]|uniref:KLLA0F10198p n=1 Tax=Kluyveromyces lactis (strain ATCC 8585 / CBS 2359 / DSM 70799 / NBRC 1267 / NRRL Y-1140 / WM37) TaxID=284590 RepID=B5FVA0_KLULA|nr:uncharacterized protein KLLA0_F10198g [Kluyveromyces lactis]CAR64395.1 KLLA0F10198p [Kluyveromyces lactis]|eukprot:XP_002999429.1 uncharacterized protein KLLA0_F10198g [Kluyveromyces lactis]